MNESQMWPFDQPRNCATLTTIHVMQKGAPITSAYHDEKDHGWQFLSEHVPRTKDAMVVTLEEIVATDPTISEVADLPPGWMAKREAIGAPWHRELQYLDAPQVIVDWSTLTTEEEFFDLVLPQCGSPAWHGRNLDALADSWVKGGIDEQGPPYAFGFFSLAATRNELSSFRDAVLRLAEESIYENGGRYIQDAEQTGRANSEGR